MLSPEQRAAFEAKFAPQSTTSEQTSTETTTVEQPVKTEAAPDTGKSEQVKAEPGRIPYSRFQEVNHAKRAAEERVAKLEQELKELRAGSSTPKSSKSYLDELIEQERNQNQPQTQVTPQSEYEGRLTELERHQAGMILDNMVANAKRDYPDLPDDVLFAALGAKMTVEDAVALWDDMKAKVQKATGWGSVPETQTAPKPKVATPPMPGKVPPTGQPKPKTLNEAHAAFRRHLMTMPR